MNFSIALFGSAILGTAFLYSIFAWLVSRTPLFWLVQCLIVIAATLPLMLLDAGDLVLVLLLSSLVTVVVSHCLQPLPLRAEPFDEANVQASRRPTINLKSLMSGVILACVITALVTRIFENNRPIDGTYPSTHPARLVGIGLAIGLWSNSILLLCFGNPLGRRRTLGLLLALTLSLFWAGWNDTTVVPKIVELWNWLRPLPLVIFLAPSAMSKSSVLLAWLFFLIVNASLVTFVIWVLGILPRPIQRGQKCAESKQRRSRRGERKTTATVPRIAFRVACVLVAGVITTAMIVASMTCYVMLLPPESNVQPHRLYQAGKPNGIFDLWEAGSEIAKNAILDSTIPVLPGPALQSEIAAHEKVFKQIDAGLTKPNCTWIDWSTGEVFRKRGSAAIAMENLGGVELRAAARGLSARSLQAQADGRPDDVLADGIRCLGIAEAVSVDANLISSLVGTAIEGIAVAMMQPAIQHASKTQLKATANALDQLIENSDSAEVEMERIRKNEEAYLWFHGGWKDRLAISLLNPDNSFQSVLHATIRRNAFRILLRTGIAIEIYHRDFDLYPDNLNLLTPVYLPKIPIDVFDPDNRHSPLRYQVSLDGSQYTLYSVGINGRDENGTVSVENYHQEGDLDLAAIFGDRLMINQKEVEEYQKWNAPDAYDQDSTEDDFLEGDLLEEFDNGDVDDPSWGDQAPDQK